MTVHNAMLQKIVNPAVTKASETNTNPDWDEMGKAIMKKYDVDESDKNEVLLYAKRNWYGYKGDWSGYFNAAKESMTKNESKLNAADINQFAWVLFLNSKDESVLNTALEWSNRSVELSEAGFLPNHLDTKANLLYKLGKKDEAIAVQEEAVKLATEQKNDHCIKQSTDNIAKMKRGEPTWEESKN